MESSVTTIGAGRERSIEFWKDAVEQHGTVGIIDLLILLANWS